MTQPNRSGASYAPTPAPTPVADLTPAARALLAAALPSARAGGVVRLRVQDGDAWGVIVVDVDEARRELAREHKPGEG